MRTITSGPWPRSRAGAPSTIRSTESGPSPRPRTAGRWETCCKPIALSAGEPSGGPADVEIGWHLHPDAWGQGYATEAAGAVLDDAFSRGLARVIAVTAPGNRASQAVCRRLGMTHLGRTTRYYDAPNELFEKLPG